MKKLELLFIFGFPIFIMSDIGQTLTEKLSLLQLILIYFIVLFLFNISEIKKYISKYFDIIFYEKETNYQEKRNSYEEEHYDSKIEEHKDALIELFKLDNGFTKDELKKSYKALSKQYHPDLNMGRGDIKYYEDKMKEINSGYKELLKRVS